jgi:hypothetical protein
MLGKLQVILGEGFPCKEGLGILDQSRYSVVGATLQLE